MTAKATDMWVIIETCDDIPGEWIAHCLDLDVLSQGTSFSHAVQMIEEAITLVLEDDASQGLDPLKRGDTTPGDTWCELLGAFAANLGAFPVAEPPTDSGFTYAILHLDFARTPDKWWAWRADPAVRHSFNQAFAAGLAADDKENRETAAEWAVVDGDGLLFLVLALDSPRGRGRHKAETASVSPSS